MRRLARLLFALCAVVSLVLCVAACVLWVRSYDSGDGWYKSEADRVVSVRSIRGRFGVEITTIEAAERPWRHSEGPSKPWTGSGAAGRLGFSGHYRLPMTNPPEPEGWLRLTVLTVPHWFLAAALSILPVAFAAGCRRAARRGPAGLCPRCGYDLRASPERCPECGTAASRSA